MDGTTPAFRCLIPCAAKLNEFVNNWWKNQEICICLKTTFERKIIKKIAEQHNLCKINIYLPVPTYLDGVRHACKVE